MSTQRWDFVLHLRPRDAVNDDVTEVTGVFIGTFLQAFDHITRIAAQHQSVIMKHVLTSSTTGVSAVSKEVRHLTAEPKGAQQNLLLPPPTEPKSTITLPVIPEGCEAVEQFVCQPQEYPENAAKHERDNNLDSSRVYH